MPPLGERLVSLIEIISACTCSALFASVPLNCNFLLGLFCPVESLSIITLPAKIASLELIVIGALVNVSASDHIVTVFVVPLPSTAPEPIASSIMLPLESTPNLCVAVPVIVPEP